MTARVRAATTADLPTVAEIYRHYVETSTATWRHDVPDEQWWADLLNSVTEAGRPFLVLEDDDGIQGYAYLGNYRDRAGWAYTAEDTIYLRPDAAGRGYGRSLLGALVDEASKTDVREMMAMISSDATASIALHERLGFTEVGRLVGTGTKFGRTLDCVVMQRSLVR